LADFFRGPQRVVSVKLAVFLSYPELLPPIGDWIEQQNQSIRKEEEVKNRY
jgi:hypothetical protein